MQQNFHNKLNLKIYKISCNRYKLIANNITNNIKLNDTYVGIFNNTYSIFKIYVKKTIKQCYVPKVHKAKMNYITSFRVKEYFFIENQFYFN